MIDNDSIMLEDTQVYDVRRCEDGALIGIRYTRKVANELKAEYEDLWSEPCYVAITHIQDKPETIGQRNASNEE